MATNRTLLRELRDRLLAGGAEVPARAESFHRERTRLLGEVDAALSWRGVLGRGQRAAQLGAAVADLCDRAPVLRELLDQVGQIEQQLGGATHTLEAIAALDLRDPDGIPARLELLRAEVRRLGRRAKSDDELATDQRRCGEARTATVRLCEALALWRVAEEALAGIRVAARTAALAAALPGLGQRLCRGGPTPQWQAELKALVDPLHQLVHREQPRAITQTEKIIKDLPRWARVLGEACDEGEALSARFKARRKDWPGEDDRTFAELFAQARDLEQGFVGRAAAVRRDGLADLEARCALFAQVVAPDPGLAQWLSDLRAQTPDSPRDHEDWCELLREADTAFCNRVTRSENALLATFSAEWEACRLRLEVVGGVPRLAQRDADFARLRVGFDNLSGVGQGADALTLLGAVDQLRRLRADLEALELAIRRDQTGLLDAQAALQRRAYWLAARARGLAITLPTLDAVLVRLGEQGGAGPDQAPAPDAGPSALAPPGPGAPGGLESVRLQLEAQERLVSGAQAQFVQVCGDAIVAGQGRMARVLAVLGQGGSPGPQPGPQPDLAEGDLDGLAAALEGVRSRLATLEASVAGQEQSLRGQFARLQESLAAVPATGLGHHDRSDREAVLRQLQQWRPDDPADPVERLQALGELIENARQIEQRIASAARRLDEQGAALGERLRRFNGLFLQGYCPDLYGRVEGLLHPPEQTRWPRGAQAGQLREAERLLRLLERQGSRLAAREVGETVLVLEGQVRRTRDAQTQALLDEVRGLAPGQQPPARLRRRLAEQRLDHGLQIL